MTPITDILPLLPQKPPFVLIDELLYADEHRSRTAFRIPVNHLFADDGRWSEAGLLENMAQSVAAGAGYRAAQANEPVLPGFIGAVKKFEVSRLPAVNNRLVTETLITEKIFNTLIVEATVLLDNELIARCELNIFVGSQA